jgi:hypothetical protein
MTIVSPRRVLTSAATFVAAIVVALAVPVSELRTYSIVTQCCCPDPSNCHCPDHNPDHSTQPSMRACHRTSHEMVAPQLPSFRPVEIALAIAPPLVAAPAVIAMPEPHVAPTPGEPYGPS